MLTEAEQQHVIGRMWSAGVWFSHVPRWADSREAISPDVELRSLEPSAWLADYDVHFPPLPASDPNAAFVESAEERFLTDPVFSDTVLRAIDSLLAESQGTDVHSYDWGELL